MTSEVRLPIRDDQVRIVTAHVGGDRPLDGVEFGMMLRGQVRLTCGAGSARALAQPRDTLRVPAGLCGCALSLGVGVPPRSGWHGTPVLKPGDATGAMPNGLTEHGLATSRARPSGTPRGDPLPHVETGVRVGRGRAATPRLAADLTRPFAPTARCRRAGVGHHAADRSRWPVGTRPGSRGDAHAVTGGLATRLLKGRCDGADSPRSRSKSVLP